MTDASNEKEIIRVDLGRWMGGGDFGRSSAFQLKDHSIIDKKKKQSRFYSRSIHNG
jgi:hypothetical protein